MERTPARDAYTLIFTADLRLRAFSVEAGRRLGVSPEAIGRPLHELPRVFGRIDLHELVRTAAQSGETFHHETQNRRGRWYSLSVEPAWLDDGARGYVVTLLDVSHLKEAETRAAHLSAIVEGCDDAVISKDLNGNILSWNEGATRLYGYTAQQAIGRQISFLVPDEKMEELADIFRQLHNNQRVESLETVRLKSNGGRVEISLTVSPIRDDEGRMVAASSIARDITMRKRTERALRTAEAKYQDLYDNAPDMYVTVDAQTGDVIDCNETMLAALAMRRNEVVGKPAISLYHPECRGESQRAFQRFLTRGQVQGVELKMLRSDGTDIDVSLNATAVRDDAGNILRSRSVLRDISRRKQAEAKVREAIERRDQFLAMLSHELRNPLGAMLNACHVCRCSKAVESPAGPIEVIERQGRQMARLLDDLLDVSRIVHGKIKLHLEPLDLAAVIGEALEASRYDLERKGLHLETEIAGPLPISGDPARLQQLLVNLLTNAAKYTPMGGRVVVSAVREQQRLRLDVCDSGVGMPAGIVDMIFDPFVQAGIGVDRNEGGMGVGLSLVRSIAELHGGCVTAKSDGPGAGSTFTVYLPVDQQVEPACCSPTPELPKLEKKPRILVIEDNRDNREMLRMLLSMDGFEVDVAEDGESGLAAFDRGLPDVAVVDIGLPGLDGYQVARAVRQRHHDRNVLLIALTGYGRPEDRRRVMEAGFDEHLVKPLDPNKLTRLLALPK